MTQILSNTEVGSPIARPRWMIIFCLHQECNEIFNHSQSQPNNPLDWERLCWAYQTIDLLPPLEEEATWSQDVYIPPFFVSGGVTQALATDALYEMV